MSMKIYKGFEITTGSLPEVYRLVESYRMTLRLKAEEMMDRFAAEPENGPNWFSKWMSYRHIIRTQKVRLFVADTDFSITVFPVEGVFYGIAFTEHEDWFKGWCSQPLVKEFSYWDNSDPDEDVPAYEWARRKRIWNEIFKYEPVPSNRGFSIDVMDADGPAPKGWMRDAMHGKTPK